MFCWGVGGTGEQSEKCMNKACADRARQPSALQTEEEEEGGEKGEHQ